MAILGKTIKTAQNPADKTRSTAASTIELFLTIVNS